MADNPGTGTTDIARVNKPNIGIANKNVADNPGTGKTNANVIHKSGTYIINANRAKKLGIVNRQPRHNKCSRSGQTRHKK